MLSILLTATQWLRSKATLIGLALLVAFIVLAKVVTQLVSVGVTKERLRTLEHNMKEYQVEKAADLRIRSMSADAVRKRLYDDWSSRS